MNAPVQEKSLAEIKLGRMCQKMANIGDYAKILETQTGVQCSDVIEHCGKKYLAVVRVVPYGGDGDESGSVF